MPWSTTSKLAVLSAFALFLALLTPFLSHLCISLFTFIPSLPIQGHTLTNPLFPSRRSSPSSSSPDSQPFTCDPSHTYKTELVSLSPLLIYIHSLISPSEITSLLATAAPRFAPSEVVLPNGLKQPVPDRTSSSAGLPRDDPAVACVLDRARGFIGTMLRDGWDEMGPPQLVRYGPGQRFNLHHDWYDTPRWATDGTQRRWNRVASFFAVLDGNCTGGETHFPYVEGIAKQSPRLEPRWVGGWVNAEGEEDLRPLWREHEDGGLAFRPVPGNGIFWINLHPNGTGDMRTMHAGLPLEEGTKTAMNIWPRQYYPYD